MKKNILIILFAILAYLNFINNTNASNNDVKFIVTAYYSPLPDQEQYSYSVYTKRQRTYEEEKRLQGEGIRGASGKKVFSGMLAAPKNYKFGTKIYLEGLGVGEVADRGGAIVNRGVRGHSYDRIDVWMGYGDEGLRRASFWGKREVKGKFLSNDNVVNLNYSQIPLVNFKYKNKIKKIYNKEIDIFTKKITKNNEYKKLQEVLKELGLYKGLIDGNNKKIIDTIYNFQLSEGIIKSMYSNGAGNYGPITRKALKNKYDAYKVRKNNERIRLANLEKKKEEEKLREKERIIKYKKIEELSFNMATSKIQLIGSPRFGEVSTSVRELQKTLKELGYFNYNDTAIYGNITKNSIIAYQIDRKIINTKNELGAGIIGPKTRKALKNDLKEQFLKEITKKENTITNI